MQHRILITLNYAFIMCSLHLFSVLGDTLCGGDQFNLVAGNEWNNITYSSKPNASSVYDHCEWIIKASPVCVNSMVELLVKPYNPGYYIVQIHLPDDRIFQPISSKEDNERAITSERLEVVMDSIKGELEETLWLMYRCAPCERCENGVCNSTSGICECNDDFYGKNCNKRKLNVRFHSLFSTGIYRIP